MLPLLPLQNIGAYTDYVAYLVGGCVALALLGYVVITHGRTGREGDERAHEQAVADGIDDLTTSEQLVIREPDQDGAAVDLDYLATTETTQLRRWRWLQWLRRRAPYWHTVIHARPIEDADGRTIHVASVDGRLLAHRDPDALVEDALLVVEKKQARDRIPATMAEWYADDIRDGFIDIRESKARVRGDCLTRIQSNMRKNEELPVEDLRERLVYDAGFRYPRSVVREKLRDLLNDDVRMRKDGTLVWQHYG